MITIEEFIAKYNEHIDWNMEIRNNLNIPTLESNPKTKEILDDYLSGEKITTDNYEVENAKIYKYEGDNPYELQMYSYITYGTKYFWCKPDITKEDYINERMTVISNETNRYIKEIKETMKNLRGDLNSMTMLSRGINKKQHYV